MVPNFENQFNKYSLVTLDTKINVINKKLNIILLF